METRSNPLLTIGGGFFLVMIIMVLYNDASKPVSAALVTNTISQAVLLSEPALEPPVVAAPAAAPVDLNQAAGGFSSAIVESQDVAAMDTSRLVAPYESYTLTQGAHGYSYGHAAIDMTAGNGATIISPIAGQVADYFVDEWGNTTLLLENENYQVTLMHGNYSVSPGETLKIGQPIGTESNNGYTKDWQGNLCYGRDCGYHTHFNVFDKRIGANANILEIMEGAP
jgi:murein DD-endopeptidase MepM/ murein hydrolase activator NlpD